VAADEPDALAALVGDDAPAVHLLLVHPAVAVERLEDERGPIGTTTGKIVRGIRTLYQHRVREGR
jgi:hypothetical protein